MNGVYFLRSDDRNAYLRQKYLKLRRDIAAVQQALRGKVEEHQAHLNGLAKSNEELIQCIRNLSLLAWRWRYSVNIKSLAEPYFPQSLLYRRWHWPRNERHWDVRLSVSLAAPAGIGRGIVRHASLVSPMRAIRPMSLSVYLLSSKPRCNLRA